MRPHFEAAFYFISDTIRGHSPRYLRDNQGRTVWIPHDALVTSSEGKVDIKANLNMIKLPHVLAMTNMDSPHYPWIPEEISPLKGKVLVVNTGLKHEIYEVAREFIKNFYVQNFTHQPLMPDEIGDFTTFIELQKQLDKVIVASIRCGDGPYLKRVSLF